MRKRLPIDYDDKVPQQKVDELKYALDENNVVIRFKEDGYEVWWHSVLAWLANILFSFNRKMTGNDTSFMDFITTMGTFFFNIFNNKTYIYFPTKKGFSFHSFEDWCACWHELRHAIDDKNNPMWYKSSYLFFPLPARWTFRAMWEYKGYGTDLAAAAELLGAVDHYIIDWMVEDMVENFTGPNYAYMHPDEEAVRENFDRILKAIENGELSKSDPGDLPYRKMALGI